LLGRRAIDRLQEPFADVEVDGAPVVRVDEAVVPELGALVEVRDARCRQFQDGLGQ
jgi:hypothetical protein